MRIFYHLSHYISHKVAGLAYISALKLQGCTIETNPQSLNTCDAAILHDDPFQIAQLLQAYPALLSMPTVAYTVFEGSKLPEAYARHLQNIKNIWTCSHFTQQLFASCFSNVHIVPHIVQRYKPSLADLAFARDAMLANDGSFIFYSIIDAINPRKNLSALLSAFSSVTKQSTHPIRLVLKQYRAHLDLSRIYGVISLPEALSFGQMAALHITSNAYISTHHAEGWGLGIAEAMAYGKPAIATAYSGNMEFMDETNSLPIPYHMVPVSQEMCAKVPLFTPDMQWAEIDQEALIAAMKKTILHKLAPTISTNASAIENRFSSKRIGQLMVTLLQEQTH